MDDGSIVLDYNSPRNLLEATDLMSSARLTVLDGIRRSLSLFPGVPEPNGLLHYGTEQRLLIQCSPYS